MNDKHLTKIITLDVQLIGTIQKNETCHTPIKINLRYWEGSNHVTTELEFNDHLARILQKALNEVESD